MVLQQKLINTELKLDNNTFSSRPAVQPKQALLHYFPVISVKLL